MAVSLMRVHVNSRLDCTKTTDCGENIMKNLDAVEITSVDCRKP